MKNISQNVDQIIVHVYISQMPLSRETCKSDISISDTVSLGQGLSIPSKNSVEMGFSARQHESTVWAIQNSAPASLLSVTITSDMIAFSAS